MSNTEPSDITGDVGSNSGAITGFENLNGNVYGPGAPPQQPIITFVTFSIFQNGVLLGNSARTSVSGTSHISLQGQVTITTGQSVDIRWFVDGGTALLGNRILTLVEGN